MWIWVATESTESIIKPTREPMATSLYSGAGRKHPQSNCACPCGAWSLGMSGVPSHLQRPHASFTDHKGNYNLKLSGEADQSYRYGGWDRTHCKSILQCPTPSTWGPRRWKHQTPEASPHLLIQNIEDWDSGVCTFHKLSRRLPCKIKCEGSSS